MATTIQNIELPKKPRARDTSSSSQDISQELLRNADFSANESENQTYLNGGLQFDDWVEQQSSGLREFTTVTGGIRCTAETVTTSTWHQRIYQTLDASQQVVGKMYKVKATVLCSIATEFRFNVQETNSTDDQWAPENYDVEADVDRTIEVVYICTDATNQTIVFFPLVVLTAGQYYEVKNVSLKEVESFPNNNHGKIYSGRGLEFDGVTDYLSVSGGPFDISVVSSVITVAGWFNSYSISTEQCIWNNGKDASNRFGVSLRSSRLIVNYFNGTSYYNWQSSTLLQDTWYRFAGVLDGQGGIKVYINGVLDSTVSGLGPYRFNQFQTVGMTGSTSTSNQKFFNGKMSNLQVWDAAFTQADVTYDYLNPESLALNASGTALTESNLKLWYPMQDGHRGQQSYILDGANTGLGTELVTNGDFATDSDWTTGTGILIEDGVCKFNGNKNANIQQNIGLVAGEVYKATFTISNYESGELDVNIGGSTRQGDYAANGTYEVIEASANSGILYFQENNAAGGFVGHLDNVSCRRINDKHHATTVFYGDELIPHTNDRTFAGASNWANAAGDNAFANYDETGSGQLTVTPDDVSDVQYAFLDGAIGDDWEADMVAGRTYRLTYDIHVSAFTKGTLSVGLSTDAVPAVMKVKTDYTATNGTGATATLDFVYVAADHEMITIYAAANTVLTADFDNFSLKEVGVASGWTDADQQLHIPQTALQSYNELAWNHGSGDVTVSALGAGFGTNDFAISYVIHPDDQITTTTRFLGLSATSNTGRVVHQLANDGELRIYIQDESTTSVNFDLATASGVLDPGQTYHVVESFDRTANLITTYINGVASGVTIDISTLDGNINCNGEVEFYTFSTDSARGFITEVALWKNTTLSATEALELYNDGKPLDALTHTKASTLYGYWRNNGLSTWVNLANPGTKDSSTNTLTETILIPEGVDATRDSQGFLMNRARSTSSFNNTASGGYVEIPVAAVDDDLAFLGVGDGFSIQAWVKVNNEVSNGALILSRNNNTDGYRLEYTQAEKLAFGIEENGNISHAVTDSAISTNTWYHVVGTFDGDPSNNGSGEVKLYLNGETDGSVTNNVTSADMDTSISPMRIGKHYWEGAVLFDGEIDGVLIYNAVLSATEVLQNYNATKRDHKN